MKLSHEHEAIKRILETKHQELVVELGAYEGIRIVRTADEFDECRLAVDRELATVDLERRSALKRQIADALARLGNGEYGVCLRCGAEIAPARLNSVPWTPYCLRCQEVTERKRYKSSSVVACDGIGDQSATDTLGR